MQRGELLSSVRTAYISLGDVRKLCKKIPDSLLIHDVECYTLRYTTLYKDMPVQAEALVCRPLNCAEPRLALYCHGTNIPLNQGRGAKRFYAYSGPFKGDDYQEIEECIIPLASNGYFVVVPEYTGYGSTASLDHPFIYYPELVQSVFDAAYASRALSQVLNADIGKDLYITGWSQGGGAAFFTEKTIESDASYSTDFDVVGVSALSGPYDLYNFLGEIFRNRDKFYITMALYVWGAYSMNVFSANMQRPADMIFRLPVYDQSTAYLTAGGSPRTVFQPYFMDAILDGTDTGAISAINESQTCSGWSPRARVFLYHGRKDDVVSYINAQSTYENMKELGNVSLHTFSEGGHFDRVDKYMTSTLIRFRKLREGTLGDELDESLDEILDTDTSAKEEKK